MPVIHVWNVVAGSVHTSTGGGGTVTLPNYMPPALTGEEDLVVLAFAKTDGYISRLPTSIVFGTEPLQLIKAKEQDNGSGAGVGSAMYELKNPRNFFAIANIVGTWPAGVNNCDWILIAFCLDHLHPTVHKRTPVSDGGNSGTATVDAPSSGGDLVIDALGIMAASALTVGAGQTKLTTDVTPGWMAANGSREDAGGATTTMSWTFTGTVWAQVAVAFIPEPPPSYLAPGKKNIVRGSPDSGGHDMAARLVGVAAGDELGELIFEDTFKNGLNAWRLAITGAAALPVITTTEVFVAPNASLLDGGAAVNDRSYMHKFLHSLEPGNIGVEAWVKLPSIDEHTPDFFINISYMSPDGLASYMGSLSFQSLDDTWVLGQPAGVPSYPILTTPLPPPNNKGFMPVKFVINWKTGKYVRVTISDRVFPVPDLPLPTGFLWLPGQIQVTLYAKFSAYFTTNGDVVIGLVKITRDEPEE